MGNFAEFLSYPFGKVRELITPKTVVDLLKTKCDLHAAKQRELDTTKDLERTLVLLEDSRKQETKLREEKDALIQLVNDIRATMERE